MKVADHVQDGEQILYQAYPSRAPLVAPLALAALAALAGLFVWHQYQETWVWIPAGILVLVGGGLGLVRYVRLASRIYVVTDRRLLRMTGIFSRSSMDSYLDKINNVECRQSFLGRIFGFGDLEIDTASETGAEVFPQISAPLTFKRAIDAATSAFHVTHLAGGAGGAAGARPAMDGGVAGGGGGAEKIRQLKRLLDEGLISQAEFDSKRKQLLDQL
jgi:membrane protein YdbS with pleckstrin-like domain